MPFEFEKTSIPDVILITPKVFEDERGFLFETYEKSAFEKAGICGDFVLNFESRSKYGVLRGLHFQKKPYGQAKIVRCTSGKILDVAVDIRKDSATFEKYVSVELSEKNKKMLYIPKGFAHGFVVLSEFADVFYSVDNVYAPKYESGIIWNDHTANIKWPIDAPLISEKDKKLLSLKNILK